MGLQKKALEAMDPVRARGLYIINNQGERLYDDCWITGLPSGLEIVKFNGSLGLEASFEGRIGGVVCKETLKVLFESIDDPKCLPSVRSKWRKGEEKPPIFMSFGFGYWQSYIEGDTSVALKRYPVVALEFLDLMSSNYMLPVTRGPLEIGA